MVSAVSVPLSECLNGREEIGKIQAVNYSFSLYKESANVIRVFMAFQANRELGVVECQENAH
jgi:hypothetical protein